MSFIIFNPDHDIALANNTISFIPPLTAAKMQEDLSTLPYWYSDGDNILSPHDISTNIKEIAGRIGINNNIVCNNKQIKNQENEKVITWGWNKAIAYKLRNMGFRNIPDDKTLEKIREMSSRRYSIKLLEALRNINGTCGVRKIIETGDQLNDFISADSNFILKSLWSNSGKGIIWCKGNFMQQTRNRVMSEVEKYGGIIYEPVYSKVRDFAMEYKIADGKTSFIGYSLFNTNIYGGYESNEIMGNEFIREELGKYINSKLIDEANSIITNFIDENIVPFYEGYLGIDMMICNNNSDFLLHPCIEINLRMNMGIVASEIYRRMIENGKKGKYYIEYNKSTEELKIRDKMFKEQYPLIFNGTKISSGYMSLTPIYRDTKYNAYIIIDK